jgi:hypothetical protein
MRGAMDTVIEVTCTKNGKLAKIVKQKDGDDNFKTSFDLKQVKLGIDEDLEPITSCIVELKEPSLNQIEKPKGDIQKMIFEVIKSSRGKRMNKNDLVNEVINESNESGTKRRKDTVKRAIDDMLAGSSLE